MPQRKKASDELVCLGTGDGQASGENGHSSYLYALGGRTLLIDCGEPVSRRLAARKFDWERLDAIFISHTHADHLGGLFMLLQGLWLAGRSRDLVIYLPRHAIEPVKQLLKVSYLFDDLFSFRIHWVPLVAGTAVKIGGVKVTPFPTTHLDSLKISFGRKYRVKFDAFSFRLDWAGQSIIHSADIGSPEDLLPLFGRKPVSLAVCELAHFQPEELISFLQSRKMERLALIHLPLHLRRNAASLKRQFGKALPDTMVTIPKDGETIELKGK